MSINEKHVKLLAIGCAILVMLCIAVPIIAYKLGYIKVIQNVSAGGGDQ